MQAHRVLAATDLSEAADLALVEAHERTEPDGSLLVCYARPAWPGANAPVASPVPLASPPTEETVRRARDAVTARMTACTGRTAERFSVAIEHDEPHAAIVKRAEAWGADLVVVGHRGETGLSRVWLGSVAEKVARLAHCPVLVVRPKSGSRTIVVGTDFSDPALPAVRAACDEARRVGGTVNLIHCIEVPSLPPDGVGFFGAEVPATVFEQLEAEASRRLEAAMHACQVPGTAQSTWERPSSALVRSADTLAADLLVVGTRGRTGIKRVLLGSVAEAVIRCASCSVLVVRLHEQQ